MGAEIVNPVPVDEVEPWARQLASSLLGNPYEENFARRLGWRRRTWLAERTWGVRDRGRWVGTLATQPRTVTIPGPGTSTRELAADALTGVSVAATHRRQGLLTGMITRSLAAAHDRGDALSMLVAAEWPIYGRFGYAPASSLTHYHYDPRGPGLAIPADPGSVRQVEPAEAARVADAIFDSARRRRAGQVDRPDPWWDRRFGLDGYETLTGTEQHWFVHDGEDGPDGLLGWMASEHFDLTRRGTIKIDEFAAATASAERDLWGYLAGIDLVGDIDFWGPVDDPVRFLLNDGRALRHTEVVDFLWIRLLDVPAALTARSYATDGEIVLDVLDPTTGSYAAGRVLLSVHDGEANCTRTDRPADVRLDQRALAAAYLGGSRLALLALAQPVVELTAGALDRLDVMLSTPLAPYNQTGF